MARAGAAAGKIWVTFNNESNTFIGIMYQSDWSCGGNKALFKNAPSSHMLPNRSILTIKVMSGDSLVRSDGKPMRVTFAARLGAYAGDGEGNYAVMIYTRNIKPPFRITNYHLIKDERVLSTRPCSTLLAFLSVLVIA